LYPVTAQPRGGPPSAVRPVPTAPVSGSPTSDRRATCRGVRSANGVRKADRADNPRDLTSLEGRSCRPKRVRGPTWAVEVVIAVRRLREQYPRWGKDKLAVLLAREGLAVSVSMVGRIVCHLKRTGQLVEPFIGRVKARKRTRDRAYAVRKPKEYMAREPGDIVQIDTLDVYPLPGVALKHFTARDVVSRWDVVTIRSRATALAAKTMLEEVLERMPFPVRALQVDGGSEFMKEFEEECQAKGIAL